MARKTTKKRPSSGSPDGFWYDEAEADRAVEFIQTYMAHVKGEWAGRQFKLEPWQRETVTKLFGWKRPDGSRKYRKLFCFVPRKNGKTTFGAALALYCLLADREPGAEVYSVAADRDQAAIMFDVAKGMVEQSGALERRCEIYRRAIVVPSTGSAYHVLSADAPTKHGKNSSAVLFDELHAQPNRELYDVMKTSQGSRRQPLFLMFTTAGYDRQSVCWEEYEYACKVRDGVIVDETYLPVIYEAKIDDDWTDPKVWARANPNLGVSVKPEFLADECRRAQESPAYQNTFRRLYLDQWTEQAERWLDMDVWDRNAGPIEWQGYIDRICFGGLDLASTSDIAALALVFSDEDGGFSCKWRLWVPEETMVRRAKKDRIQYDVWAREGFLTITDGNTTDYDVIREEIKQIATDFRLTELAYDRWNATQIVTQLQEDGATMVPFGQGYQSMAAPTKELEKLLRGGMFRHGNNPVLRWMASNIAVKQDPAGNMKPAKDKSADKIDGLVAAIMALGRAIVNPGGGSIYDRREMVIL